MFFKGFIVSTLLLVSFGCSSVIKVSTNTEASLSLLDWSGLDGEGTLLGKAPLEIDAGTLDNKVLKISGKDKSPQYWVFTALQGRSMDLKTTLLPIPDAENEEDENEDDEEYEEKDDKDKKGLIEKLNQNMRILLGSYQALARQEYEESVRLATALHKNMPDIAAPHIIMGLSFLKRQQREKARSEFKLAKALDPADPSIDELIKLSGGN